MSIGRIRKPAFLILSLPLTLGGLATGDLPSAGQRPLPVDRYRSGVGELQVPFGRAAAWPPSPASVAATPREALADATIVAVLAQAIMVAVDRAGAEVAAFCRSMAPCAIIHSMIGMEALGSVSSASVPDDNWV